jgi:hypothetical protein
MTIHFCQKYKPVFLTKGKSFFYRFATNPLFLLWQFQEIIGQLSSQLPPEGAVLEAGEKGIHFRQ